MTVTMQPLPEAGLAELDARSISAWFGERKVLDRVSLVMPAGSVTALIGPSGCGKSTFLRTLNRMHEITEGGWVTGRVLLDGEEIYGPRVSAMALRRRVGMVFQRATVFPTMSIFGNVAAGLKVDRRTHGGTLEERVEQALRQAALWDEVKDRLHKSATALSGGQQQRLCIARALAPAPDVVLLDEPTSALDPIATQRIEELAYQLKRDYTIIIVTHNMQQAARISDTTSLFYMGTLVESGTTRQIFTNPADPQTEAYITGRFG